MKKAFMYIILSIFSFSLYAQDETVKLVNTGKMVVGSSGTIYIQGSLEALKTSEIKQEGKTILKNDFINNVQSGNVFVTTINPGMIEFRGDKVQHIRGNADKSNSWIEFPDVMINNQTRIRLDTDSAAVVVASEMGLTTNDLHVNRGRLILDSKIKTDVSDLMSNTAHLLVEGSVIYPQGNDDRESDEKGIIEVKLATGDNYLNRRLLGFTPPFQKIYADYFFFNFLSIPTNKNDMEKNFNFVNNPKTALTGGKGYLIGLGIVQDEAFYRNSLDPAWEGALYEERFKDMFTFGRDFAPGSLTQFVNYDGNIRDAFTGERLYTEDVILDIDTGLNYLGNPYTTPLDMSTFLDVANDATDDWKVSRGEGSTKDVLNKYYLLSSGTGTYIPGTQDYSYSLNLSYMVVQKRGSTIEQAKGSEGLLSPMQMFIIRKNKTSTKSQITIPKRFRTHSQAPFLRSNNNEYEILNEILIETKDTQTGGFDRLCILFSDDSDLASKDLYDAPKIFNNTRGVNQIYTLSSDNKEMTTNVIPFSTEKLPMYLKPSSQAQNVTLKASRLHSFRGGKFYLEDVQTGKKVELTNNSTYTFTSSPTDKANRFILHFSDIIPGVTSNMEISEKIIPQVTYYNKEISLSGLQDKHIGKNIFVYDLMGRIIHQTKIDQAPLMQFLFSPARGIYVLWAEDIHEITGKKIIVK